MQRCSICINSFCIFKLCVKWMYMKLADCRIHALALKNIWDPNIDLQILRDNGEIFYMGFYDGLTPFGWVMLLVIFFSKILQRLYKSLRLYIKGNLKSASYAKNMFLVKYWIFKVLIYKRFVYNHKYVIITLTLIWHKMVSTIFLQW